MYEFLTVVLKIVLKSNNKICKKLCNLVFGMAVYTKNAWMGKQESSKRYEEKKLFQIMLFCITFFKLFTNLIFFLWT